jgi:hypothetical protein
MEGDEEEDEEGGKKKQQQQQQQQARSKVWHIEIDRRQHLAVKKRCLELNLPCLEEYDFANDKMTPGTQTLNPELAVPRGVRLCKRQDDARYTNPKP